MDFENIEFDVGASLMFAIFNTMLLLDIPVTWVPSRTTLSKMPLSPRRWLLASWMIKLFARFFRRLLSISMRWNLFQVWALSTSWHPSLQTATIFPMWNSRMAMPLVSRPRLRYQVLKLRLITALLPSAASLLFCRTVKERVVKDTRVQDGYPYTFPNRLPCVGLC